MVRTYKRKTDRAVNTEDRLNNAAKLVREEGIAIRTAAKAQDVDRMTLTRFLKNNEFGYKICGKVRQVFTQDQELELAAHVKALDNCFYGLSVEKLRILAYDYGSANNLNIPDNWKRDRKAGKPMHI